MTERGPVSDPAQAKLLLKLVRQLLKGDAALGGTADGGVLVGKPGQAYPEPVLRRAVTLGLIRRSPRGLSATPEAAAYVRRMLVAGEEAFADQHRDIVQSSVEMDGAQQPVSRNLNESPLAGLARLRDRSGNAFFPPETIAAGERLHADFTRGQLQPRMTASWEPRLSRRTKGEVGGMSDIAASAMEARRRFGRAMDAMGPELSGVAADICCFGKGLELVERERQWPARSAKLLLRAALMTLARHYAPDAGPAREGLRHWGSDDFRPQSQAFGSSGSGAPT
jgi:hypothetical protein